MFECFRKGTRVKFHHKIKARTIIPSGKVFETPVVAVGRKIQVEGWGFLLFRQEGIANVFACYEVASVRIVWPEEVVEYVVGGYFGEDGIFG